MRVLYLLLIAIFAYLLGGANVIKNNYVRKQSDNNTELTKHSRRIRVVLCIVIDIAKTVFVCLFGGWLLGKVGAPIVGKLLAGYFVMTGDMYPPYNRFQGGKGILCAVIMAAMVDWRIGLSCLIVFLISVLLTRYVFIGSILGALSLPICLWIFGYEPLQCLLGLLCALLIVVKHAENIQRLIARKENKLYIRH